MSSIHPAAQAVIMAGGLGTRLRPYTYVLPKPLVPVGEHPILEYILRQLARADFRRVTLVVGYKAEILQSVIGDGSRFGLEIDYFKEDSPLGTMGALASLTNLEENFLVMNGDLCTDMDFRSFFNQHMEQGPAMTVASYYRIHRMEFGVLDIDAANARVTSFREKPEIGLWVSMGIYALRRDAVALIPTQTFFGFDTLMHTLLGRGIPVGIFPFAGRWHDIGRPDDYFRVQDEFEKYGSAIFGLGS